MISNTGTHIKAATMWEDWESLSIERSLNLVHQRTLSCRVGDKSLWTGCKSSKKVNRLLAQCWLVAQSAHSTRCVGKTPAPHPVLPYTTSGVCLHLSPLSSCRCGFTPRSSGDTKGYLNTSPPFFSRLLTKFPFFSRLLVKVH